ncbi:MAG TPA: cytochrome c oxidase assembly protein [Solirubrobacterales bacterium]|nr:cytochrome c oxidase assembly protein [Solirubrobacterales bacterium]
MTPPVGHAAATFAPLEAVPLTVAALLYARRATTLASRGRPVPLWRQVCFGSGVALVAIALFSPIGHMAEELVLMHMVEHLLIADIAALLLVLGLTGPLLQPILAIPAFDRLRVLAHPAVAFPLWAANLYFWHIPALYEAAYGAAPVHALEHGSFLVFGCLMWMPVVGPLPVPAWFGNGWRLGYILAVRFAGVILGNVLMWSGAVLYPRYAAGEAYWGIQPLADQSTAGAIMMVEGTFVALGAFAWLFFRTAQQGTERQRLVELAERQGIALDEGRAARAVAAGQGALLEERLLAGRDDRERA